MRQHFSNYLLRIYLGINLKVGSCCCERYTWLPSDPHSYNLNKLIFTQIQLLEGVEIGSDKALEPTRTDPVAICITNAVPIIIFCTFLGTLLNRIANPPSPISLSANFSGLLTNSEYFILVALALDKNFVNLFLLLLLLLF